MIGEPVNKDIKIPAFVRVADAKEGDPVLERVTGRNGEFDYRTAVVRKRTPKRITIRHTGQTYDESGRCVIKGEFHRFLLVDPTPEAVAEFAARKTVRVEANEKEERQHAERRAEEAKQTNAAVDWISTVTDREEILRVLSFDNLQQIWYSIEAARAVAATPEKS